MFNTNSFTLNELYKLYKFALSEPTKITLIKIHYQLHMHIKLYYAYNIYTKKLFF